MYNINNVDHTYHMDIIFQDVLNNDINYYIFFILHKNLLNEVFDELFGKTRNFKILQEIVEEYDCNYCITFKRSKLISTIIYPMEKNGTGWIIYIG